MKSPSPARAPATASRPELVRSGVIQTTAGRVTWSATATGLRTLSLPDPLPRPRTQHPDASGPAPYGLHDRLRRYFRGEPLAFDDVSLDLSGLAPFTQRVLLAVRAIPRGQVRSYGQVATSIGRPTAARAVGGVMARNPVCIVVPCHRVVGSDGSLTGFGGGLDMKRRLLEMEGALFKG